MNTFTNNGNEYQIETKDNGRFNLRQRNRHFPNGGAEWQVVGRGTIVNGVIENRSGFLAMDDALDAEILATI